MPGARQSARLAALSVLGLGAALATASVTAAGVFGTRNPETALRYAPYDATAKAKLAERLVLGPLATGGLPSAAAQEQARDLAHAALRRDPTEVTALAALALIESVNQRNDRAATMLERSEKLSRRDLQAQLWLLERSVERGDVPGALRHYDIAMRTSRDSREKLMSVLMSASEDPAIAAELTRILRAAPDWRAEFLTKVAWEAPSAVTLNQVAARNLNAGDPQERQLLSRALSRMAAMGRPDLAWQSFTRAGGSAARVQDPNFCSDTPLPPFGWQYTDNAALRPEPCQRVPGTEATVLLMPAAPDAAGDAATQLLHLGGGQFRLQALTGGITAAGSTGPSVTVRCAVGNAELLRYRLPAAPEEGRRIEVDFAVPATCGFQWLSIQAVPGEPGEAGAAAPWISDVKIAPIAPAAAKP
ncbi:MAG: hypothetical protein J7500_06970 [Sphingomonas sp.]|uniref:tetratricopeptide repeat protein n=1 Tax=Sphingomonas sp. TaxID=28214 RepID=UPI001AFFEAC3|nr:hypothetical protein [Sphingomonas sp.]MBO9622436.1 hypothetical protein [Sphingomonas sp.]